MKRKTAIILSLSLLVNLIAGSAYALETMSVAANEISGEVTDDDIGSTAEKAAEKPITEATSEAFAENGGEVSTLGVNSNGEYTANVRTDVGAGPFTTLSAPKGTAWGSVNKGEEVVVLEAEMYAGTKYYYIQYNTAKGLKRGYISSYYIQSNNEVPGKIKTVSYGNGLKTCTAKAAIPLRIGNTIWFDDSFGHALNKGDVVRVLRNDGNWMFVEHYIGDNANLRGWVDFARITFYEKGKDYLRWVFPNYTPQTDNRFYVESSVTGAIYYNLVDQMGIWNNSNGSEDNFPVPWTFTETLDRENSNLIIRSIDLNQKEEMTGVLGRTDTIKEYGNYKCRITIDDNFKQLTNYQNQKLKFVVSHEIGHTIGLYDINSQNLPDSILTMKYPSVMDYKQGNNLTQRQYVDIVGAWDYFNGYK